MVGRPKFGPHRIAQHNERHRLRGKLLHPLELRAQLSEPSEHALLRLIDSLTHLVACEVCRASTNRQPSQVLPWGTQPG